MTEQVTDDAWIALREAMPSFRDTWDAVVSQSSYDPRIPYANIPDMVAHVLDLVQSREHPDEQEAFFVALERLLANESDDVCEFLTIGVLEGFTDEAEERAIDHRVIHKRLAGPASRSAWLHALAYTHPELTWSDDLGLQRTRPLTPAVGRFRAMQGKPLDDQDGFLLEGVLEDGQAEPGHILRHRVSSGLYLRAPIAAVQASNEAGSFTKLILPHVNERSAEYYRGIFWGLEHDPMEFEIALHEEE